MFGYVYGQGLQKPFTPQTLGRKVHEILAAPQLNYADAA